MQQQRPCWQTNTLTKKAVRSTPETQSTTSTQLPTPSPHNKQGQFPLQRTTSSWRSRVLTVRWRSTPSTTKTVGDQLAVDAAAGQTTADSPRHLARLPHHTGAAQLLDLVNNSTTLRLQRNKNTPYAAYTAEMQTQPSAKDQNVRRTQ